LTQNPVHTPLPPRIIDRAEHGISRRFISPNALRVLYRLNEAGYAAYLVGGAVRDLLLGGRPKDFDVATDATPEQVKRLFRNCRLIGRRFRLAHVIFGREIVEVATFRSNEEASEGDRQSVDGRLVRDNIYGSIEDDAIRRDFTANALYYGVQDFAVRDYTGGYDDVRGKVLRLIGDPATRYREDPVRMLRAVRLAAKLGFRIDPDAWHELAALAPLIADSAPARLFDELMKLFAGGHAFESLRWLEASGLFHQLFPDVAAALEHDGAFELGRGIEMALTQLDQRIEAERPVSPAFLFAALLWPAFRRAFEARQAALDEIDDIHALAEKVAQQVVTRQVERVALPRRLTLPMIEIWMLQLRLDDPKSRRARRLVSHPRFRAAYDFLALRAEDEPGAKARLAQWTELAQLSPGPLESADQNTDEDPLDDAAEPGPGDKPRRGRRRGRRRGKSRPGPAAVDE